MITGFIFYLNNFIIYNPVHSRGLKRFIFSCQAKIEEDKMDDVTDVDECRVEMRWFTAKTWKKPSQPLFRAIGGKVGKVKHNTKVNLFGGIS